MLSRFARLGFAFVLPAALAGQGNHSTLCDAAPEIWEQVLDASVRIGYEQAGKLIGPEEVAKQRREKIAALLEKYPNDFFVRRAYLTHTKDGVASEELIAKFKDYADSHPDSSGAQFLYGEALTGRRTPEAIKIFDSLIAKDPSFPWPYRGLATIYQAPRFSDRARLKLNAIAFVERCPDTKIAAGLATHLDNAKLADFVKRTRARLTGRTDDESVESWEQLWRLEFRVVPKEDHDKLRQQIAADLRELEKLDLSKYRQLKSILRAGYQLTGDKAAAARFDTAAKGPQDLTNAYFAASEAWNKSNPFPGPSATSDEKAAFNRKWLAFLNPWVAKLPSEQFLATLRLRAMVEIPETPSAEIIAEGKRALKLSRETPQMVFEMNSTPAIVSAAWAQRGVELDAVPALIREGQEISAKQDRARAVSQSSDLYASPDDSLHAASQKWFRDNFAWDALTTAYFQIGKSNEARRTLAEWEEALNGRKQKVAAIKAAREKQPPVAAAPGRADPLRSAEDDMVKYIGVDESRYWNVVAALAAHEKRNLDALAIYQASLRALSSAPNSGDLSKVEPARKANEIWKQAGGTAEGWQHWLESARPAASNGPEPSRWNVIQTMLPEFSIRERSGATWTLAKVKGKTTLLNVWATWCGPCRAELPHLQKLHDSLQSRDDVQVVTLNVDDNIGLVEPYLAENKFTFPVLFAKEYVEGLAGSPGIPTNWISSTDGRLRFESVGFGGDGDAWIQAVLKQFQQAR